MHWEKSNLVCDVFFSFMPVFRFLQLDLNLVLFFDTQSDEWSSYYVLLPAVQNLHSYISNVNLVEDQK